jgi:putative membrane protein
LKGFIFSIVLQVIVVIVVFPLIHSEFKVSQKIGDGVFIVLAFMALNFLLRQLFLIFTLGIAGIVYYLSLGTAGLIVNAVVLLLIGNFFPDKMTVPGFFPAIVGGFLLSIVNFLSSK